MNNSETLYDFLNSDFMMASFLKENTLTRYRFCTSQNIKNLEYDRLYYSTPANFNDPYDTLLYANYFEILGNVASNLNVGINQFWNVFRMDKRIQ